MRKHYLSPYMKTVAMLPVRPLAISGEQTGWNRQLSREAKGMPDWNDEDDTPQESSGTWFK